MRDREEIGKGYRGENREERACLDEEAGIMCRETVPKHTFNEQLEDFEVC